MATAAKTLESGALVRRLAEARARTDELFTIMRSEAFYDRPIPERHRVIFYLGHLEAFDWNLLGSRLSQEDSLHSALDRLFAFGIDPVDGGLPSDKPSDWPQRPEVDSYVRGVRNEIDSILAVPEDSRARCREIAQLLNVVIEHRLMHAETLAYMLHQLPANRKLAQTDLNTPSTQLINPYMVEIPAGRATLGLPREQLSYHQKHGTEQNDWGEAFGWDNEFAEHQVNVPAFRIDAYNVTNRNFLRFVNDGGYQQRSLWKEADWNWLQARDTSQHHPGFWVQLGNGWFWRTMFAEVPLPLEWPVYVSHAEASAYARWACKELPSEAEWHRAAYGVRGGQDAGERSYPWGGEPPDATRGNFDFERWDPTPVGAFTAGSSAFGVMDLLGNGWEWTRTPFAPFHGFEPFPFYPGYSANFFDGRHYVMKGGSAQTASCMLRRSFRNWFQPHYPFVYASFRCVDH